MALFKSAEEKEQARLEKAQRVLAKYGLEGLNPAYQQAVQEIAQELAGSGLSEFGALLSNDDRAMNRAQTQYVHAIMKQNFIIIRELDTLIKIFARVGSNCEG